MDLFEITGGARLSGAIPVSGAKNAVLPIMAASILTSQKSIIHNVPDLQDVATMRKILEYLGARVSFSGGTLTIDPSSVSKSDAPYEFVKTMRASVSLLGPLISKFGSARFSLPGGCVIGSRPIDLHLKGLEKLGVSVGIEQGYINAESSGPLKGTYIFLGGNFGSSVLATCNLMSAAVLAQGETCIEFAACEPEVVDLAGFLTAMGAKIQGAGSPLIRIEGVSSLQGVEYTIIPDRIEAGTFLLSGIMTRGKVAVENCCPRHLGAFIEKLKEAGIPVSLYDHAIEADGSRGWNAVDIVTLAYPGFPTDLQAQMMALLTIARGVSIVTEKVFPERFIHTGELNRLGSNILLDGSGAIVRGVEGLKGARVMASDLRASAALVIAGLAAEGTTSVSRVYHLFRGYEKFEDKLASLGASISRKKDIS
ncbi:MAG: UDP-N-acetylglucosamine 1-carboxyvinyltransferase [Candidatus Ratteibacteria bacterium]